MNKKNAISRHFFLTLMASLLPIVPIYAQEQLPPQVEQLLLQAGVPTSAFSAKVIPISPINLTSQTNHVNYTNQAQTKLTINENIAMSPASTMKLVTSYIALEELGPTFRWKTQLLSEATIKKNSLRGLLYLKGGGAPDLTWERLGSMFRTLYNQGVRHIKGNIVIDRSYFQPSRFDVDVLPFDESPDAYYNVIPDALLVQSNLTSFELDSTEKKLFIRTSPPSSNIQIKNRMKLSDFPCSKWEDRWVPPSIKTDRQHRTNISLLGEFPRDCKITNSINILDRNLYIESLIRQLWKEMGGQWQGHVVDGVTTPNAKLIVEKTSDTLADNLRIINKRSDNAMTRSLYLTLGAESNQQIEGATSFQMAETRIRHFMNLQGIDDRGFIVDNGSGLSRTERISANQMSALLLRASQSNWFAEFSSSLPIVAIDGTMRKRLIGSTAAARARMKTGTLRDTVAVAGYVQDQENQTWVVVAMINHDNASQARPALDALIEWVASSGNSDKPQVEQTHTMNHQ